jgi:hypothetical protein
MIDVAGMEVAARHRAPGKGAGQRAFQHIARPGVNDWVVVVGDLKGPDEELSSLVDDVKSAIDAAVAVDPLPSRALERVNGLLSGVAVDRGAVYECAVLLARLQLDTCGAWVTMAGAGRPRPIVLRYAAWVDIRGHGSGPLGRPDAAPSDDRVGLGPGDALVLCSDAMIGSRTVEGAVLGDTLLPDLLVGVAGGSADAVADSILAEVAEVAGTVQEDGVVVVMRVPDRVRHDSIRWIAESTGVAVGELPETRYPSKQEQSDFWDQPVIPPREALIRLPPEPPSIPALRRLLRRLLRSWRLSGPAEADVELLATEVATNAFSLTASPVTVVVRYTGRAVRVEVGDGDREPPRKRTRFKDLQGHRLALVESLASHWGVSSTPTGSRMWFEITTTDRE